MTCSAEAFRILASPFPTNIPPYAWMDSCSDQYIGAIPAAAAKAAKEAGLTLEIYRFNRFKPGLINIFANSVLNQKFDAVMFSDTQEPPWDQLKKSENYISEFALSAVVHKSSGIDIMRRDDMKKMTAYLQDTRGNGQVIQTLKDKALPYKLTTRIDQVMVDLTSTADHYILMSDFNARSAIKKNAKLSPSLKVVKMADFDFNNYLYLYANPNNKLAAFNQLDKALGNIYSKGYWQFITEEYFKKWLSIDSCDYNVGASQAYRVITLDIDQAM